MMMIWLLEMRLLLVILLFDKILSEQAQSSSNAHKAKFQRNDLFSWYLSAFYSQIRFIQFKKQFWVCCRFHSKWMHHHRIKFSFFFRFWYSNKMRHYTRWFCIYVRYSVQTMRIQCGPAYTRSHTVKW